MIRAASRKDAQLAWQTVEAEVQKGGLLGLDEPVRMVLVRKRGSHTRRPTFAFGYKRTADQILVRDVAQLVLRTSPYDFALNGRGVHRAVQRLTRQINEKERRHLYVADIANCFGSFSNGGVVENLPLPEEIVRLVILGEGAKLEGNASPTVYSPSAYGLPSGLPQGSLLSNLVAGALLRPAFDAIAESHSGVGYADDFAVACYSGEEGHAVHQALKGQLAALPAGDLKLKEHMIQFAGLGVPFLGYEFHEAHDGSVQPVPNQERIDAFLRKLADRFGDLPSAEIDDAVLAAASAWSRPYTAWTPHYGVDELDFNPFEYRALSSVQEAQLAASAPSPVKHGVDEQPPWG